MKGAGYTVSVILRHTPKLTTVHDISAGMHEGSRVYRISDIATRTKTNYDILSIYSTYIHVRNACNRHHRTRNTHDNYNSNEKTGSHKTTHVQVLRQSFYG